MKAVCCSDWAIAVEPGSDRAEKDPLIWHTHCGQEMIGVGITVRFCPFCGADRSGYPTSEGAKT